jgi:rhomboid protease GluP
MPLLSNHRIEKNIAFPEWDDQHLKSMIFETLMDYAQSVPIIEGNTIRAKGKMTWRTWGDEIEISTENKTVNVAVQSPEKSFIKSKSVQQTLDKVVAKIEVYLQNYDPNYWQEKSVDYQNIEEAVSVNVPEELTWKDWFKKGGIPVTLGLIGLNIIIFIAMIATGTDFMSPKTDDLLAWGANFAPVTLNGASWRLFTSTFIHIGVVHLLMNMYALFYIGTLLEPLLGKIKFLGAYILAGILASVASLWWNNWVISAGASGAIFGMYGVFVALFIGKFLKISENAALFTSIGIFIFYNIVYGVGTDNNIDNAAHIGGFISGLLLGLAITPLLKSKYAEQSNKQNNKLIAIFGFLILAAFGFQTYQKLPRDIVGYEADMERFSRLEREALLFYETLNYTDSNSQTAQKSSLQHGIGQWHEALKILNRYENAKLPQYLKKRNQKLKEYCLLRLKSFEIIQKSMQDNNPYPIELEPIYEEIQQILDELNADN